MKMPDVPKKSEDLMLVLPFITSRKQVQREQEIRQIVPDHFDHLIVQKWGKMSMLFQVVEQSENT